MAKNDSADFWNDFVGDHTSDQEGPRNGPHQGEEENDPEEDATFEELRHSLLTQMESPQFANRLKAQLRANLALQLTPNEILTAKPPGQRADPVRELAHAVVAQHLALSGCDFSLSVFLPESGLNRDLHPMSLPNLLAYLRVKYAGFRTDERSLLSLLVAHLPVAEDAISTSFLTLFSRQNGGPDSYSRSVQTDLSERERDFLDLELQLHNIKGKLGWQTGERWILDEALARFESAVAGSTRSLVMSEALKTKESEIRHVVEEESQRHSRELLSVTAHWEARLQDQEAKFAIVQQRLQIAEQKAYLDRQTVLQQQETATQVESQNRAAFEARLKQLEEKEVELVSHAKQVAEFSKTLQVKESSIQRTVDQRVGESLRLRAKSLDEREEKLKKDEISLNKLKEHLTRTIMNESGEPDVTACIEPKPFLQKIKSEFSRLHRENQKLKTRLATIADYETLRSQKADYEREIKSLRGQVTSLQRHLQDERQEHTAMVRELTDKVVQPDQTVEALRREGETLKDKLMLESMRWETERSRLKTVVKDRGREISRLRDRFAQLQEKYETVTAKMARMQELSSQATWMVTHASTPVPQIRVRSSVLPSEPLSSDESSSTLHSINDAKRRIRLLEQEATTMQAHFNQYRRQITTQFRSSPPTSQSIPLVDSSPFPAPSTVKSPSHPSTSNGRVEVPRKLLLTQYLLNDSARTTHNEAPQPKSIFPGFSGGDLRRASGVSLDTELREAEEQARIARLENEVVIAVAGRGDVEEIDNGEFESKIAADVKELMELTKKEDDFDDDGGW